MIGSVSGAGGDPDALGVLVERFRREMRYPRQEDYEYAAGRRDLLPILSRGELETAIAAPTLAHAAEFRRIASNTYGGPGNQIQINVHLKGGPAAASELARSVRHLLYGPGSDFDRLDDVLEDSAWKVRGFGEALAVKCLAIVFPDRWLPFFLYPGKYGKGAIMRLPELPIEPLFEEGKSRAQLAVESNDALRALLVPYFGDDVTGATRFLWWRLHSAYGNPTATYR
ncbi:MAG: hypothetical protein ACLP50_31870 [Solirubrobacteraceae bacterium]